ncbi:MAG: hypothetical protein Tsb005_14700 [Gammaproteobacteria bacterium]
MYSLISPFLSFIILYFQYFRLKISVQFFARLGLKNSQEKRHQNMYDEFSSN